MEKKKLVILTGAGMSAESGISTFRDQDGLWENHRIEDVASPEGFAKNPTLVHEFYNQRRKNVVEVKPHQGFYDLVELEKEYQVQIITQNIDDLHERAGSSSILHLHGEILKARSTINPNHVIPWTQDLTVDSRSPEGEPLRPHIVWFGEAVPALETAAQMVSEADLLFIIGTSLQVYPAASLHHYAPPRCEKHYFDPKTSQLQDSSFHCHPVLASQAIASWKNYSLNQGK